MKVFTLIHAPLRLAAASAFCLKPPPTVAQLVVLAAMVVVPLYLSHNSIIKHYNNNRPIFRHQHYRWTLLVLVIPPYIHHKREGSRLLLLLLPLWLEIMGFCRTWCHPKWGEIQKKSRKLKMGFIFLYRLVCYFLNWSWLMMRVSGLSLDMNPLHD